MKKFLLLTAAVAIGASSAMAITDGQEYEVKDNIACKNIWVRSVNTYAQGFVEYPFASLNYARTATLAKVNGQDKVVVGWEDLDDKSSGTLGRISVLDFFNGKLEKTIVPTVDGTEITGLLCVNQIGCDDFGHVWFCGYVATPYNIEKGTATPFKVYKVDDFETGACSLAFELELPADEKDASARVDYYAVSGDVTRTDAACVFMCATSGGSGLHVLGWRAEQGGDFEPMMEDASYVSTKMKESYPADQANWGTAPCVRILKDDDYSGNLFYVDGFTTCPTLYDQTGSMLESFASASDLAPKVGTNGVTEFEINGVNHIFYSIEQYDAGSTCRARVCRLGENSSFEGMQELWTVPANGLGEISDGGARYHAVDARVYPSKDGSGIEGAYLLTYKGRNGIAVYSVAPTEWKDPNLDGVEDIIADEDVNAPVEYFNLNGVAVSADNLTPGVYVTRQGSKASKVIVK